MGSILHQWDNQISFFTSFPEFELCLFDNRGSGLTASPDIYYSTSEMAQDALELLNYLQWKRVHVVGVSMGGMIAQELAWKLENRVASLTLVSTYAYFNGMTLPAIQNIVLSKPSNTILAFCERISNLLFPQGWLNAPCLVDSKYKDNREYAITYFNHRYSQTGLQTPTGRFRQQIACLAHYMDKRLSDLREHGYPILILTGDQDQVLRQPTSSVYLASALNDRLEIYVGGGHALRMQDPEWHDRLLMENIRKGMEIVNN